MVKEKTKPPKQKYGNMESKENVNLFLFINVVLQSSAFPLLRKRRIQ